MAECIDLTVPTRVPGSPSLMAAVRLSIDTGREVSIPWTRVRDRMIRYTDLACGYTEYFDGSILAFGEDVDGTKQWCVGLRKGGG